MAGGGSRGIHAARPTGRRLRSACTQVAIGVVWTDARLEARSRSTANTAVRPDAIPVGDAGGHDGSEAVGQLQTQLSVLTQFLWETPEVTTAAIAVYQLQMSRLTYPYRPTAAWARTAPTGFGAAGNLDTPRDRGAADRALAKARAVSPSASYLKRHQVTKCPCSWFGLDFVEVPSLRRRSVGPPPSAIHGGGRLSRHPCRSAHCATPAFSLHPSRVLCCLSLRALRSKAGQSRARAEQEQNRTKVEQSRTEQNKSGAEQSKSCGAPGPVVVRLAGGSDLSYATAGKPDCYRVRGVLGFKFTIKLCGIRRRRDRSGVSRSPISATTESVLRTHHPDRGPN
jgi:hypothetical protein